MTIVDLLTAAESGEHERYPCALEADVRTTEEAIGRPLPPSFRTFVMQFSNGAYLYSVQEVSAVGDGNKQIAAIQKIILPGRPQATERIPIRDGGEVLGEQLVPFSLDHNGNAWCFLTGSPDPNGEYPVAYFDTTGRRLHGKQASFVDWFAILVDNENEVIRSIYDEDVLYDELNLG
jgi:SMI1 / KNR4 family (SUKH-1)